MAAHISTYQPLCFTVASLIGASFVFPGVHTIDGGTSLSTPPFLSGLGPVFLVWLTAPAMALTLVPLVFLLLRTCLLRGEDPFHKVLWVRVVPLPPPPMGALSLTYKLICGVRLGHAQQS